MAPVAICFASGCVVLAVAGGGGERLVAFGPVVGCLPLSFLVGLDGGGVVDIAASV